LKIEPTGGEESPRLFFWEKAEITLDKPRQDPYYEIEGGFDRQVDI
jgi:hypothetical protein